MNIQIKPIQYGFKQAVMLEPLFGEKPLFSDLYSIKLLLKDEATNLLDVLEVKISRSDYEVLGDNKEERVDALLVQHGIIKEEIN